MLERIEISGYKSIHDMQLDLKPINILIGSNGVGKTNFISFFKLINAVYEQRLRRYSMQNGAEELLHYGSKRTQEISGYLKFGDNAYRISLQPRNDGTLFIFEEQSIYKNSPFSHYNREESLIKDSASFRDKWLRKYLQSYRIYHFHDTGAGSPLRTPANVNDNLYLKTDGDNLPAFLFMLQEKHPMTLKRIEFSVRAVMAYFERFEVTPSPVDPTRISLAWSDIQYHDKYFDATDLSDGSLRFIALSTLLLQPQLPEVIIIDEPELGLHPAAISKLSGLIKSAAARGCQMIISTQSVNLLDDFDAEDIITVDRKDGQSVFSRLDSQELGEWLEKYTLGELWAKSVINGQPASL